jgi:hypothetical protein
MCGKKNSQQPKRCNVQKVTETIVQFKVSDRASENAWDDLVMFISKKDGVPISNIKEFLAPYEQEYMESYYSDDPNAVKKNGTWKYSKYLPNAYKSAKSVICRAAEKSVPIWENGVVMGKSAVEQSIQDILKGGIKVRDIDMEIGRHIKALKDIEHMGFRANVLQRIKDTWPLVEA